MRLAKRLELPPDDALRGNLLDLDVGLVVPVVVGRLGAGAADAHRLERAVDPGAIRDDHDWFAAGHVEFDADRAGSAADRPAALLCPTLCPLVPWSDLPVVFLVWLDDRPAFLRDLLQLPRDCQRLRRDASVLDLPSKSIALQVHPRIFAGDRRAFALRPPGYRTAFWLGRTAFWLGRTAFWLGRHQDLLDRRRFHFGGLTERKVLVWWRVL